MACYHGMSPDMLWYFSCTFCEKAYSNKSQQRHFKTNSCHSNIANVLDRTPVCTLTATRVSQGKICRAGFVQLFIANILDRTPICKLTASPVSQGKMCREGFVQLFIANVLDRTPVCKVRAMIFPVSQGKIHRTWFVHPFNANGSDWIRYAMRDFHAKPRENVQSRISAALDRKCFR